MPPRARPPAPACVGSARRARLRAVTTGLYRSRTRAAFSPPLTKVEGQKRRQQQRGDRLPRLPHVQGRDQIVPQQHDRGHQRPTAQQPQHRAAERAAPPIDIGRRACKRAAREHVHDAAQDAVLTDRHHLQQRHNGRRQEGRERPVDKPPIAMTTSLGSYSRKSTRGMRTSATSAYAMAQSMPTVVICLVLWIMFPPPKKNAHPKAQFCLSGVHFGCAQKRAHPLRTSSFIQTLLSVLELHQVLRSRARGLYRRSGIAPCPEDIVGIRLFVL